MNEVRLELERYDGLKRMNQCKAQRIDALEQELEKVKNDHEEELDKLAKEGKVRIIERLHGVYSYFFSKEPSVKYKGFDDVKEEVEEHFKQGLFNEELEKQKQGQLKGLLKRNAEKDIKISDLKAEIERLKSRSLWERIRNK